MFEISEQMLVQLIDILPELIVIYIVFDFLGSFFFGKRWFMYLILIINVMLYKVRESLEPMNNNQQIIVMFLIVTIILIAIIYIVTVHNSLVVIQPCQFVWINHNWVINTGIEMILILSLSSF